MKDNQLTSLPLGEFLSQVIVLIMGRKLEIYFVMKYLDKILAYWMDKILAYFIFWFIAKYCIVSCCISICCYQIMK